MNPMRQLIRLVEAAYHPSAAEQFIEKAEPVIGGMAHQFGMQASYIEASDNNTVEIEALTVPPESMGKFEALMVHLTTLADSLNVTLEILSVPEDQGRFYQQCGFHPGNGKMVRSPEVSPPKPESTYKAGKQVPPIEQFMHIVAIRAQQVRQYGIIMASPEPVGDDVVRIALFAFPPKRRDGVVHLLEIICSMADKWGISMLIMKSTASEVSVFLDAGFIRRGSSMVRLAHKTPED